MLAKYRSGRLMLSELGDIKHLTDGSNSQIFNGIVRESNKPTIIKMMKMSPRDIENANREFALEKDVLIRLSHPNIVEYMGHGKEDGRSFICLEALKGGSLSSVLNAYKYENPCGGVPFTYERILEIGVSLARALNYIHYKFSEEATIIHRDLKPDNIAFTDTGVLKLIDFGLSTCVNRRECALQSYAMTGRTGSARYMAPEAFMRMPYNETVDVYSFGLIMWQVSTGLVPFGALTMSECKHRIVLNRERPSLEPIFIDDSVISVPSPITDLLSRCWHWKPDLRPTSNDVETELTRLLKKCKANKQRKGCSFWSFKR
eukprot:CAMPEP_0182419702 /NCGR_PEP_ID=MMETSP1167-20130531/4089_1 /TAXON_ID=2988 /ORGANISM="Mallomonas Sp, Strain CCMP3275" /LENGTH=316 /DNA_ID=CAMNT_0024594761 /DNA_START=272 /DNA_END=1222 /DNA_ORIENTATION=+